jgi:hypothetical protein
LPEALAYVRVHYNHSKRSISHEPAQLIGRFDVRLRVWQAVRRAGLDTPENRRHIVSSFLAIMRPMASARLVFPALRAWGYAVAVSPGIWPRGQLLVLVLPALLALLSFGRGAGLLKRMVYRLRLEHPTDDFLKHRYGLGQH